MQKCLILATLLIVVGLIILGAVNWAVIPCDASGSPFAVDQPVGYGQKSPVLERYQYKREVNQDVIAIRGTITPTYYNNPGSESFVSYHEIEIGLGHQNYIEISCDIRPNYSPRVFITLFKRGVRLTDRYWLGKDISIGDTVEYQIGISIVGESSYYICQLSDPNEIWGPIMNYYYDTSNPSTTINKIWASTELYMTIDGISSIFQATTNPSVVEEIYLSGSGSWVKPLEDDAFVPNPVDYVDWPFVYVYSMSDNGCISNSHLSFKQPNAEDQLDIQVVLQGDNRPTPDGWQVPLGVGFYPPGCNDATLLNPGSTEYYFSGISSYEDTVSGTRAQLIIGPVWHDSYDITSDTTTTLLNVKRNVTID